MLPDSLSKLLSRARHFSKENRKFILGLWKKRNLDELFHPEHEAAFEKINCLECANCCKTTSPIFRDVDIERISKHIGERPADFISKYLHRDKDDDMVLNSAPCAFLGADNYCTIYDVRPKACREYPHTDRKNVSQVLELTYLNTLICPAVAMIVENIKKKSETGKF